MVEREKIIPVSVVIVNYNGLEYLKRTITAILSIEYPCYEVIVVDNGSSDGSVQFLEKNDDVKLIKSNRIGEKNYACNLGIEEAKGEYILLMDNDLVITESSIMKNLINEYMLLESCGCISLAYVNDGSDITKGYGCFTSFYYSWEKPNITLRELELMHGTHVGSPNGSGLFMKKDLRIDVGGYDDHLQFGGDVDDLGMR